MSWFKRRPRPGQATRGVKTGHVAVFDPDGQLIDSGTIPGAVNYMTTAPTSPNTTGTLIAVILDELPGSTYDGYIYFIKNSGGG